MAKVFISHSSADKKWAEKLKETLDQHGFSTWLDTESLEPGDNIQRKIEDAIQSSDAIIVLVGSRQEPDELQRFTWSIALEAMWRDPNKVIIPFLLKDAELPSFISNHQAIRARNPRSDWSQAVHNLVRALKGEADLSELGEAADEKVRAPQEDRLSYIKEVAESLKAVEGFGER
ncbi:MAG: toll/interleukin-1 receptor domain-containing protein [Armatimonadota bacterium]|nr:toll/interleukin-1 receptor domain-containing protein [Armatimonadota bacterium]